MVSAEIIARVKKVLPDFNALSVRQPYGDEVRLRVEPRDFKDTCLALHKILLSPAMMLFACDERKARGSFVIHCVFADLRNGRWIIVGMDIAQEEPYFDTLAKSMHSASLFEREIREMFGVEPREIRI